jgi:outer membrane lipoprotein SlyB
MEAVTKRLHPLLTVAAISLTVFSAVGVAALTGVLPHSVGSTKEAAPAALVAAPDVAASTPVSSVAEKPVEETAPMPPAAARSTPAPKPAHKKVAKAPTPVQVAQAPQAQGAAVPPPPPAPIAAPKPVPAGALGVVESVLELKQAAEKSNGVGPIAGGIAGAVLGNQFGKGMTRNVITVAGAAGGALAGTAIEKNVRATTHWAITVRLDDGSYSTINSDAQPFWHGGERVRLLNGKLQPA